MLYNAYFVDESCKIDSKGVVKGTPQEYKRVERRLLCLYYVKGGVV